MKATIEPVVERKVTIEMTEDEAKMLKELVGRLPFSIIEELSTKYSIGKYGDIRRITSRIYNALDNIID